MCSGTGDTDSDNEDKSKVEVGDELMQRQCQKLTRCGDGLLIVFGQKGNDEGSS